jgi:RNA polymerase sigma-70 factor (ECF subfamily)
MSMERKKIFIELYDPIHSRFERFCKARVYGQMDYKDLMHDTIVIAFQKFDSNVEPKTFLSFLFGISIRVLANNKRRDVKNSAHQFFLAQKDISYDQGIEKEEIEHLYTALNLLSEIQKECLILFEIVGYSLKEIAELHETNENTVKQRLRRGRIQLKSILTKHVELDKTSLL